jgi:queuine tRNA-ribosyltransferase
MTIHLPDPRVERSLGSHPPGHLEVLATDEAGAARATRLWTAHGPIETPCFMPVGTYGVVKGLLPADLRACGTQMVLANAYHLEHRPGRETVRKLGGLHSMMAWDGPILTDSGGYQVFSLRSLQRIDDDGVDYRTHFDGSAHRMTPQSVLETQAALGSDICMVLDHCPPGDAPTELVREAMDRSTRWAELASRERKNLLGPDQLCFGIVQGGVDLALRREHLRRLSDLGFDGLALGGLSVGESVAATHQTIAAIAPEMPADKPRYVMGIGTAKDLVAAVSSGIDLFDCVIPTRHARNGQLLARHGKLNIRRAEFRDDPRPIDDECGCVACLAHSRAYLRHLHAQKDPLYVRLASAHNLYFLHQLVAAMRQALRAGRFGALRDEILDVISRH